MGNHERQKLRQELFQKQQEELAQQRLVRRANYQGEAVVVKTKTPGGPKFKGPNQRMRYLEDSVNFFGCANVVEHFREGELIGVHHADNMVVNEGLNAFLDKMFDGSTQITTWYTGLIDLVGYTIIALTDTYDDINQVANGWDEFTDYTDANNASSAVTRPVWVSDPASGQAITNTTTKAIADITATGDVKGIFISGGGAANATKGDHAADGTLMSAALFSGGDVGVVNGDQLKITFTMNAANP